MAFSHVLEYAVVVLQARLEIPQEVKELDDPRFSLDILNGAMNRLNSLEHAPPPILALAKRLYDAATSDLPTKLDFGGPKSER